MSTFIPDSVKAYMLRAIEQGTAAVCYALPGEKSCRAINSEFILNTFGSPWCQRVEVMPDGTIHGSAVTHVPESSTSQEQHHASVEAVKDALAGDMSRKTVISTTICGEAHIDWLRFADEYMSHLDYAFRAIVYTPGTGLWIVASPELLLKVNAAGCSVESMALAGTRSVEDADTPWDEKNIVEHRVVDEFIRNAMRQNGLTPAPSDEVATFTAGNVCHICTRISGVSKDKVDIAKLVDTLSPTPALCGFPREESLALINAHEAHSRGLYGGYMGVKDASGALLLFVVLRSVHVDPATNRYCFYAGGGINPLSDSDTEWAETRIKAASAINIIYQMQIVTNA